MAAGDSLIQWTPQSAEFPASNYATFDTRNTHLVLDFDTTTQETVYFKGVMPNHYTGTGDVIVNVHAAASSAVTGTIGWGVSFERIGDRQQDLDADGFATEQLITPVTVSGTAGHVDIMSVTVTNANADGLQPGEGFRLRVRRDVTNDTASGDAELFAVDIEEA